MNLRQQAAEIKSAMQAIVDGAKAESRDLSDDEANEIEVKATEHAALIERAEKAEKAAATVASLASAPVDSETPDLGTKADAGPLGMRIAQSDSFKAFRAANPSGVDGGTPIYLEAKGVGDISDIVGRKATLDTTFGEYRHERAPGYRDYLPYDANTWPTSFLDLVTVGSTNSRSLEYAQVTAEANNAAIVAEGELKPLSDLTTGVADAKVFTYADGFDATNQFLADEPALATFMEGAVRRHLQVLIEDRLLNGAGGASAPLGVLATTGVQSQAFATDVITTIAGAVQKVEDVGGADPQAIVLNPADAWALRLLKDGDGRYLSGGPFQAGVAPSLWGIPIVTSRRVAAGTAIVGNFRDNVTFLQREALNVLAFNQHKDYAQRNMVYVRAELRAMQLVYAPREIVVADLTAV